MKTVGIILLIAIRLLSFSQSAENLDKLNGYRSLKFKTDIMTLSQKFELLPTPDNSNTDNYMILNKSEDQIDRSSIFFLGTWFNSIHLKFYKNQLFSITLFKRIKFEDIDNQRKMEKEYGIRGELFKVSDELSSLFGEYSKNTSKPPITARLWETNINQVEYRIDFTPNKLFEDIPVLYIAVEFTHKPLLNNSILDQYK